MTSDRDPASRTQPPDSAAVDVSRLAHDVANSITSVAAFAHLVRTDSRLPADLQRQADLLVSESERLASMMDTLVGLARGRASALAPSAGPTEVAVDATPSAAAPNEQAPAGTRPARVLVVDDEPSIRDFLGRVLERSGHTVVLCGSGREALDAVAADPPDAILCDHRMTGMDGMTFHEAVVAIAPQLGRRFAFMTGDVTNPSLREFAETRGVRLLGKPFDIATVTGTVSALLEDEPT